MTNRDFDTAIELKPDARVQSYYSDRIYKGSDVPQSRHMAVLEGIHYVFRWDGIAYGVPPEDVLVLSGQDPNNIMAEIAIASAKIKKLSTTELCQKWERMNDNAEPSLRSVRNWISDELEARHPEQFKNWIDSKYVKEMKTPSLFFS